MVPRLGFRCIHQHVSDIRHYWLTHLKVPQTVPCWLPGVAPSSIRGVFGGGGARPGRMGGERRGFAGAGQARGCGARWMVWRMRGGGWRGSQGLADMGGGGCVHEAHCRGGAGGGGTHACAQAGLRLVQRATRGVRFRQNTLWYSQEVIVFTGIQWGLYQQNLDAVQSQVQGPEGTEVGKGLALVQGQAQGQAQVPAKGQEGQGPGPRSVLHHGHGRWLGSPKASPPPPPSRPPNLRPQGTAFFCAFAVNFRKAFGNFDSAAFLCSRNAQNSLGNSNTPRRPPKRLHHKYTVAPVHGGS